MAKQKGDGFFNELGSGNGQEVASKVSTYKLTPKYADPYAGEQERRMAKFIISEKLAKAMDDYYTESGNPLLTHLRNQNRGYFDFFLQSADESFTDKFQVVETLGDSYAVFGLGKSPIVFNYAGVLLNTEENDWRLNFIRLFQKYLSISRLSKFKPNGVKNVVTLVYDQIRLSGALLTLRTSLKADNEMSTNFGFSMLITSSNTFNLQDLVIKRQVSENAPQPTPTGETAISKKISKTASTTAHNPVKKPAFTYVEQNTDPRFGSKVDINRTVYNRAIQKR